MLTKRGGRVSSGEEPVPASAAKQAQSEYDDFGMGVRQGEHKVSTSTQVAS